MHLRLTVTMLLGMLTVPPAAAEQILPYKAQVSTVGVCLRSGPGENYYATERLSAGTEVEVYRHAPHGWCAIRPLETSYSWVSGRYLKVRKDGLATVVADRVPSRIGSQSGAIGDSVQVRLQRGELVELLGTQQIRDGAGTTTWYKIALLPASSVGFTPNTSSRKRRTRALAGRPSGAVPRRLAGSRKLHPSAAVEVNRPKGGPKPMPAQWIDRRRPARSLGSMSGENHRQRRASQRNPRDRRGSRADRRSFPERVLLQPQKRGFRSVPRHTGPRSTTSTRNSQPYLPRRPPVGAAMSWPAGSMP